jgi:nucleoside-diphosphate-sugar epimerase
MTDKTNSKLILITGATGKVGTAFIERLLEEERYSSYRIRALCHNRLLKETDRLEVVKGTIADREVAAAAVSGVSHILHLATCKETPEDIMDVTVKGLFWILEEARASKAFKQFILLGGDAGMGHFFYPHAVPVTEEQGHSAYPGCYALSKVLEEVLVEQYCIQYDLNACCLRAPWIMEKDDFRYTLTFSREVFGGPRWCDLVEPEEAADYERAGTIPVLCNPEGEPIYRNFVHVNDLVGAILLALDNPAAAQETFNICMNEPVHYRKAADYLGETRDLDSVDIPTEFHSTWLDNSKARFLLNWSPEYDLARLIDEAWDYKRAKDDPRKIWYPG